MPREKRGEVWASFSEDQKRVVKEELLVVYTEVLNDFIQSHQADPFEATSDHLRPSVDASANRSESREPRDAVRAA